MRLRLLPDRRYRDREHAGRVLAEALDAFTGRPDVIVLALPRGGVDVAAPIAERLRAPLDVCLVHKLGVPGWPEVAAGAIGEDGALVVNDDVVRESGTTDADLTRAIDAARTELRRRQTLYRHDRPPAAVAGKTVLIVDDGVATGATMAAALRTLRRRSVAGAVVAVPTGPSEVADLFPDADRVVCPDRPGYFVGVSAAYDDFPQLTDARVAEVLARFAPE
ncbi:phosphoribosyltransferase [Gordonia aichiensis]|uniref:phosphoribosyltransferase n=1 Tax=Gordonia aichiensis TaxID=36820 RepID=UPI003264413C